MARLARITVPVAAAFLLGGAVRGGRVLGQWPGLKSSEL